MTRIHRRHPFGRAGNPIRRPRLRRQRPRRSASPIAWAARGWSTSERCPRLCRTSAWWVGRWRVERRFSDNSSRQSVCRPPNKGNREGKVRNVIRGGEEEEANTTHKNARNWLHAAIFHRWRTLGTAETGNFKVIVPHLSFLSFMDVNIKRPTPCKAKCPLVHLTQTFHQLPLAMATTFQKKKNIFFRTNALGHHFPFFLIGGINFIQIVCGGKPSVTRLTPVWYKVAHESRCSDYYMRMKDASEATQRNQNPRRYTQKKPTANRPTAVLLLAVFYVYGNIQGRALSVFEKISALFFCVCVSHCCCTYRRRSQIQLCAFPCDAFYFLVNKFKKKTSLLWTTGSRQERWAF